MPVKRAADVLGEHRPGAHGVDAGFRQRPRTERDDVPGGEDIRSTFHAQRFVHLDEAGIVDRQP